jgi:ABC-type sugar transport system substrate-binding protein
MSPSEPYWVQVREAALQHAQALAVDLIPLNTEDYPQLLSDEDQVAVAEEILGQDLDAIIGWEFPPAVAYRILQAGVPIVHTAETVISHPLFVSPSGLYEAAHLLGSYLAEQLDGQGNIVIIGGVLKRLGDDGSSRIEGLTHAFQQHPAIHLRHIPSWGRSQAYPHSMRSPKKSLNLSTLLSASDPLPWRDEMSDSPKVGDEQTLIAGIMVTRWLWRPLPRVA